MYFYIKESISKSIPKGYAKELLTGTKVLKNGIVINTHMYSEDRFTRKPKSSYTIFLCRTYKENGKTKTRQHTVCTINYWDIAESYADDLIGVEDALWFRIYGRFIPIIKQIYGEEGKKYENEEDFYDSIEEITDDFWEKVKFFEDITGKFKKTKECQVHEGHRVILAGYAQRKKEFMQNYDCFPDEYDICYDIYGNLTNEDYLSRIKNRTNTEKGPTRERIVYRDADYSEEEKKLLKRFYKTLAMKYHPDSDNGSQEEMKFINKLKNQWGI